VGDFVAVLRPGSPTIARIGAGLSAARVMSDVVLTTERLTAVERQGGALTELLGVHGRDTLRQMPARGGADDM
jgi:hypothetical protein